MDFFMVYKHWHASWHACCMSPAKSFLVNKWVCGPLPPDWSCSLCCCPSYAPHDHTPSVCSLSFPLWYLRKPPHPQLQQTAVDRVSKPWCLLTLPSKLWLLLAAILMPSLCPCPKSSMPTPATHPHTPLFLRIVFMTSYCMTPVWNHKPETDPSCQMCSCTWHQ